MTNVTKFPGIPVRPITVEDASESIRNIRDVHADDVTEMVMEVFFRYGEAGGFDFSDDALYLKDLALVMQSIKSIMLKYHGLHHPMQEAAEKMFDTDAEGIVSLRDIEIERTEDAAASPGG